MSTTNSEPARATALNINLHNIPPLLDAQGVKAKLAPLGRTLLYELASRGEIETASLGLGRGKRVFVAASIVRWLQKRAAVTKPLNLAPRRNRRPEHPA